MDMMEKRLGKKIPLHPLMLHGRRCGDTISELEAAVQVEGPGTPLETFLKHAREDPEDTWDLRPPSMK
jgi:hypothetical protein